MTDNPTISDAARQAAEAIAPHVTANDPAEQHMADTMREFIVHSIASLIERHCRVAEKDAALINIANWAVGSLPIEKKLDKINTQARRALSGE